MIVTRALGYVDQLVASV